MPETVNDRQHEEFQDLLAAAAFGTLSDEEWETLRGHLDGCAECQRELSDFQVIAAALPLTLDEGQPAPQLRNRILAMIQHEHRSTGSSIAPARHGAPGEAQTSGEGREAPRPIPRPEPLRQPTPIRRGHLWATAALVLLSLLAGAAVGRFLFADAPEPEPAGETIAMQFSTPIPNVEGELTYLPEQRLFTLSMENMPAAPADHVYQVWLIGDSGPVRAGVMDNPDGEFAVAAERARYNALAITIEPGPLGSADPTTDPIITAPFTDAETDET